MHESQNTTTDIKFIDASLYIQRDRFSKRFITRYTARETYTTVIYFQVRKAETVTTCLRTNCITLIRKDSERTLGCFSKLLVLSLRILGTLGKNGQVLKKVWVYVYVFDLFSVFFVTFHVHVFCEHVFINLMYLLYSWSYSVGLYTVEWRASD